MYELACDNALNFILWPLHPRVPFYQQVAEKLTNCIQQDILSHFWEADSLLDLREIPRLLWKLKVHYRLHKTATANSFYLQFSMADIMSLYLRKS
jgi:hypothetical protein